MIAVKVEEGLALCLKRRSIHPDRLPSLYVDHAMNR